MISAENRLKKVYQKSMVVPFNANSKFIIMSDCHRGQGNAADNFLPNQALYFGALEYYYDNSFTYIELGDGDELWENRNMKTIVDVHSDAFWMLSRFFKENRFYMLYGNHDIVKSKTSFRENNCHSFYCDCERSHVPLFPEINISEGLILENEENKQRIFLIHGHQADFFNYSLWRLARFLVRYVWRGMELVGFLDPTSAGRSHKKKEKIENKLSDFADNGDEIIIAGHTHRPVFPEAGTSLYFNDGSCVHPRCITGIEIENNKISLVKWSVRTRADRTLYVGREVLEGPVNLSEFYDMQNKKAE